jgi:hypothetical protein
MPCWPVKGIYIVEQKIFRSQVKKFDCFLNARSQSGLTPDLAVFGRKCHASSDHCEDKRKKKRVMAEHALNQVGLNAEGLIIVMVTHSPDCASYAHRLLRVSDGLLVEQHG